MLLETWEVVNTDDSSRAPGISAQPHNSDSEYLTQHSQLICTVGGVNNHQQHVELTVRVLCDPGLWCE